MKKCAAAILFAVIFTALCIRVVDTEIQLRHNNFDMAASMENSAMQGSDPAENKPGRENPAVGRPSEENSPVENKPVENKPVEKKAAEWIEKEGLVELTSLDNSFVIDLKYATTDNFTGKKIYSKSVCLLHKNTARKLIAANNAFKAQGFRIKIFDAYRPFSAQQILWDAASEEGRNYLADPKKGSVHNRGAAVDITLVDEEGKELEMPSGYDEFSERSHLDYEGCTQKQKENRELLGKTMEKYGFKRISTEWWHFEDTEGKTYPILDIPLEDFYK